MGMDLHTEDIYVIPCFNLILNLASIKQLVVYENKGT